MSNVLDEIEKRVAPGKFDELTNANLKLDIHNKIPDVMLDNTDRNRTSPFAFTGNKFEFRAVGSSANCAQSMTVLNTIMAQQLLNFKVEVDKLMKEGESKDGAILRVLRGYITDSKKIRFEGDGYSEAWEKEAKKRGLSNVKTTPYALDFYVSKKSKDLFAKNGIFTERELDARYEIMNHSYVLKIEIEAKALADIATSVVIPAAVSYLNALIENVRGLKEVGLPATAYKSQKDLITKISGHINAISEGVAKLEAASHAAHKAKSTSDSAKAYCDKVKPLFDVIRDEVDALEIIVDDDKWPLPKYREMLFIR
jgi:glutamine synthetase